MYDKKIKLIGMFFALALLSACGGGGGGGAGHRYGLLVTFS